MKKLLRGLLAAGLAAALGCGMFASAADTDYIIDSKGDQLATPLAYQVSGVLRYLGAEGAPSRSRRISLSTAKTTYTSPIPATTALLSWIKTSSSSLRSPMKGA